MSKQKLNGTRTATVILTAVLGVGVLASPAQAILVAVGGAEKEARSSVSVDGTQADNQFNDSETFGVPAESVASFGSLLTNGARTAARSGEGDIAVNAQFINTAAVDNHFYSAGSNAENLITVENFPLPVPGPIIDGKIEFFLPPAVLELQFFIEFPNEILEAHVSASINIDLFRSEFFSFDAELVGTLSELNANSLAPTVIVSPLLDVDVSPLLNPTITVTPLGLTRTITVEFPAFTGILNLGTVFPNRDFNVTYFMSASVQGQAIRSGAIASINDPFRLTGQPIPGTPITLIDGIVANNNNAVPEPITAMLGLMGLATLGMATRRRAA